ncbi:unnamed protein product [Caenorhabditis nigoni]
MMVSYLALKGNQKNRVENAILTPTETRNKNYVVVDMGNDGPEDVERRKLLKRCVKRYYRYSSNCRTMEMRIPGMSPYQIGNRIPFRMMLPKLEKSNVKELRSFIKEQRKRNAQLEGIKWSYFGSDFFGTVDVTDTIDDLVDLWDYIKRKCGKAKKSISTKLHQLVKRKKDSGTIIDDDVYFDCKDSF